MKFSESWLREWVNPEIDSDELIAQLTLLGLEVDDAEPAGGDFSGVVVAEIQSLEPHPDADKLRVCTVNAGGEDLLQIVCGAPNVYVGMKAPLATIGAVLPGNFKIKKSKLRGVPSFGMLCSASELQVSEDSAGLMDLPADAPVGEDLRTYLQLDDTIIDVDLTPNRGDCFSIRGIARDISARNNIPLHDVDAPAVAPVIDDTFPVTLQEDAGCPRYVGRVIRDIDVTAKTPLWMVEKLRRSGIRALSPVVDVTNYMLLEIGQPMHAFDLEKLSGSINVRNADAGEKVTLLDEREIALDDDTIVISDDSGAIAVAGVMGGATTGVGDTTHHIFLESAVFQPERIAGKPRKYSAHTDSAHRYERGVDPELQAFAMERATQLLLDIVGGKPGPLVETKVAAEAAKKAPITLRRSRIKRLLGIEVPNEQVVDILTRLGIQLTEVEEGWRAIAPSYRYDISIEADLIEELARVRGYETLPRTNPPINPMIRSVSEYDVSLNTIKQLLVERGYQEAITYSFVDPKQQAIVDPDQQGPVLANPISSDLSQMRTTLWVGLLDTLKKNLNRQQSAVRVFESGLKYVLQSNELKQESYIAGLVSGRVAHEQWGEAERAVDFFDVKSDLEAMFDRANVSCPVFKSGQHSALHPGQSASIMVDGEQVGWLGRLHPSVQKALGISQSAVLFEVRRDVLDKKQAIAFKEYSRFPSIRRDIAIVIADAVTLQEVRDSVAKSAPEYLNDMIIFDVYRGPGVETGCKSIALGLILQELSRTLTDEEVDNAVGQIVSNLQLDLGATLRE